MYTMLKNTGSKAILRSELPSFCFSMLIAEAFYEFGSFILECGAFLVTWFAISCCLHYIVTAARSKKDGITETGTFKLK